MNLLSANDSVGTMCSDLGGNEGHAEPLRVARICTWQSMLKLTAISSKPAESLLDFELMQLIDQHPIAASTNGLMRDVQLHTTAR